MLGTSLKTLQKRRKQGFRVVKLKEDYEKIIENQKYQIIMLQKDLHKMFIKLQDLSALVGKNSE